MDKRAELLEVAEKLSDLDLEQLIIWLKFITRNHMQPKFPRKNYEHDL